MKPEENIEAYKWAAKQAETARNCVTSTRDKIYFDRFRQHFELLALMESEANKA